MKNRRENEVVGWFLELELARERRDFERAAEAQRRLKEFGVIVKYRRKRKERRADGE